MIANDVPFLTPRFDISIAMYTTSAGVVDTYALDPKSYKAIGDDKTVYCGRGPWCNNTHNKEFAYDCPDVKHSHTVCNISWDSAADEASSIEY